MPHATTSTTDSSNYKNSHEEELNNVVNIFISDILSDRNDQRVQFKRKKSVSLTNITLKAKLLI